MNRRVWLRAVAGSVVAGAAAAAGCGGTSPGGSATSGSAGGSGCVANAPVDPRKPPPPPTVPAGTMRVPLSQVPVGVRTQVCFNDVPVEVHRTETRTTARVLVCTHWGCTVRWIPEKNWYQCPCHDGKFDEDGEVKVGPPQKALLKVPVVVDGDTVVLGS